MMAGLLAFVYWFFLTKGLWRAYHRGAVKCHVAYLTWLLLIVFGVSFLYDMWWDGRSSWVGLLLVYGTTIPYGYVLKATIPPDQRLPGWLFLSIIYIAPVFVLGIYFLHTVGEISHAQAIERADRVQMYYYIANSLFLYIPANVFLFRNEPMITMRIRYGAVVLFAGLLLIKAGAAVLLVEQEMFIAGADDPIWTDYPKTALVTLMIVPHRLILLLLYPHQIYQLYRLRKLQNHILRLLNKPAVSKSWSEVNLMSETYTAVIGILDNYLLLSMLPEEESQRLYNLIADLLIPENEEYYRLVKALTRLPV